MTERINITIPKDIKCKVDQFVDQQDDMNRSRFFTIAAYHYLQQVRKVQLKDKLAEGYSAIAEEARDLSRLTRDKQLKSLRHVQ